MASTAKSGLSTKSTATTRKKSIKPIVIDGTDIELSNPLAIVDMLDATAVDIQLQAIHNLLKFLRAYPFYLHRLIEKGIIDKTKEAVRQYNYDVVVYALELMGQLSLYDYVREIIISDEEFVIHVLNLVQDTTKLSVTTMGKLEQSLNCVSKWCDCLRVCQLIKENIDLSVLFTHLTLSDPDIQAYALEIILKLVQDVTLAEVVVNLDVFKFITLFELLLSNYPHVQHLSMKLIQKFLLFENEVVRLKFLDEDGIRRMMDIIETHGWIDLHDKAFQVIKMTATSKDVAERIGETGLKSLLLYLDQVEFRHLEEIAFETMVEFLKDNPSRRMLMDLNIIDCLFHFFNEGTKEMVQLAIIGFGLMTLEEKGIEQMEVFPGLILELFNIMTNWEETWPIRISAACSMQMMLIRGVIFPRAFMQHKRWNVLMSYLEQYPHQVPLEMALPVAGCVYNLLLNQENHRVPSENLMRALCKCLKDTSPGSDELKKTVLEILSTIACSSMARACLDDPVDCQALIFYVIDVETKPDLMKSVCELFINLNKRVYMFPRRIIETGTLVWLQKQQENPTAIPEISKLINSVYHECPFVKFHCCNRLDLKDLIDSGFFFSRGLKEESKKLKSLDQIIENRKNLARPIFLINFRRPEITKDIDSSKESASTSSNESDLLSPRFVASEVTFDGSEQVPEIAWLIEVAESTDDPQMRLYLRKAKKIFGFHPDDTIKMDYQILLDPKAYTEKIKLLAKFICETLSSRSQACETSTTFEGHISDLRDSMKSFLIPLGLLRVGTKLERAVMFKAIGDKVGIPSALARASHAIGWVEVCIQQEEQTPKVPVDCDLLFTTHLIDLETCPGTLHALNSLAAQEYMNTFSTTPKCLSKTSRPIRRVPKK